MVLDVYTVGGIEYLSQVFKGVVMTLGDSGFETLLRLAALFTVIASVLALLARQQFDALLKRMSMIFFISALCFGMKADVNIIDTKYQQNYVVSDVPMLPAYAISFLSSASNFLTTTAQNVFHTGTVNVYDAAAPARNAWGSVTLDYQRTGFGGFFDLISMLSKFDMKTVSVSEVQEYYNKLLPYMEQCIIPNIGYMKYPVLKKNVLDCPSLISCFDVSSNSDFVNLFITYDGTTQDCATFFNSEIKPLHQRFVAYGSDPTSIVAFGIPPQNAQALSDAMNTLLVAGATSLSDMIGQMGMLYAFLDGVDAFLAKSPDALQNLAYKYEVGRNIEESKQMGKTLGLYAKETIPLMKNAFEAVLVAFIPIFFIVIMFGGMKAARNVFFSMAWVYMWDPVLATINGIGNIAAIAKVSAALQQAGGQVGVLTYSSLNTIMQNLDYFPAVLGYLAISTPGLAYMLVRGGEITMMGIANMMASPVMTSPIHAEAAASAETQKIASQTGMSFGQVEYAYNAQGQAKLHALAFQQGLVSQMGYANLLTADIGAQQMSYADNVAAKRAIDKFGLNKIIDSKANLLAQGIGSGAGLGSMDRAYNAGLVSSQRSAKDAEVFQQVAARFGGVEAFQQMMSTMNYKQAGDFISEYARLAGKNLWEAVNDISFFMGQQKAVQTAGYENASLTVGADGLMRTETNKFLNEAAKFEMISQFAIAAGLAKDKDDFLGMYKTHLLHHAEESWTLDEQAAKFLNEQMRAQHKSTRFHAGDRVTMAMDEHGRITLAVGKGGASSEVLDITKAVYGNVTDVYRGRVNIYEGRNLDIGNEIMSSIVTGDSRMVRAMVGDTVWKDIREGHVFASKVADIVGSFGNWQSNLQQWKQSGVSFNAGGSVTAALKGLLAFAGVQFDESGRISSYENFDVNKIRTAIFDKYDSLAYNKNLTDAQKHSKFVGYAHSIVKGLQEASKMTPEERVITKQYQLTEQNVNQMPDSLPKAQLQTVISGKEKVNNPEGIL